MYMTIMWPSFLVEEHVLEWFENHWTKDKFEEQVLEQFENRWTKVRPWGSRKNWGHFSNRKVSLATSASLPGWKFANKDLDKWKHGKTLKLHSALLIESTKIEKLTDIHFGSREQMNPLSKNIF
jgi:hypothetical protein